MDPIPEGLCQCGCGEKTRIASRTRPECGWIKGFPIRFIHGHNKPTLGKPHSLTSIQKMKESHLRTCPRGERHYFWNGGQSKKHGLYLEVRNPTHPRADSRGYVPKHILIAEKRLGKALPEGVIVHHFPKYPSDSLVICENIAYHRLIHRRQTAYFTSGHASWRKCTYCKKYDAPENLYVRPNRSDAYHIECELYHQRQRRILRKCHTIS